MPRNKRNKGKGRAKKAKAKSESVGPTATDKKKELCDGRHGCPTLLQGLVSCKFLQDFDHKLQDIVGVGVGTTRSIMMVMANIHNKYPHVLDDEAHREHIKSFMLSNGTQHLLETDFSYQDTVAGYAGCVLMLENYTCNADLTVIATAEYEKNKDLLEGCARALVQFLSERTPCTCLYNKYSNGNDQPCICDACRPCVHGYNITPEGRAVLTRFLGTLQVELDKLQGMMSCIRAMSQVMTTTDEKHLETLNNDANRNYTKAYFLSLGTQTMIDGEGTNLSSTIAAVLLLETYDPSKGVVGFTQKVLEKNLRALNGCRRSTIKFFAKRISCSCLDQKYEDAKSEPRTGVCCNCKQTKNWNELMNCDGCKLRQYCSRKCQAANWHMHKEECEWMREGVSD